MSSDRVLAVELFNEVNRYRKDLGANALIGHTGLNQMAESHCEYMRRNRGTFELYGKNVTHLGAEGRSTAAMRIYNFSSTSENVAAALKAESNSMSSAKLVTLWKNSPNHHASMIARDYTHTGVGIVTDADGMIFATQLFGTLTASQLTTRERFSSF